MAHQRRAGGVNADEKSMYFRYFCTDNCDISFPIMQVIRQISADKLDTAEPALVNGHIILIARQDMVRGKVFLTLPRHYGN